MTTMLHFAKEKRTLHVSFRNDELRVVAKSFLFNPDTLIAKVPLRWLELLRVGQRTVRMNGLPVDLQHSQSVDSIFFDVEKRTLALEFDEKEEVFQFTEEEWKELMKFLKK
jgi:hypothetical protein